MGNALYPTSQTVDFQVHIAVDFGTDGCALAFAYKNEVTVYNKWKAKTRQRVSKTKTHILLDDQNDVAAFGSSAKQIYSNLTGIERKKWKFLERFKMSLYGEGFAHSSGKKQFIQKKDELVAMNGMRCPANVVFIAAFKQIKEIAKKHLVKLTNNAPIKDEEIQWIVTVPAIWSETAKYKMKQWIIEAGLVKETISDQCLIVYEPDCAALAVFKEFQQENDDNKQSGYILIDAGGGTVDVAAHKTMGKGGIEEMLYPTGGEWGSCYIDDEYIKLLGAIFTKQWIDNYKKQYPNIYLEIIDNFQKAKSSFYEEEKALDHAVELPYEFVQYLHEKCKESKSNLEDIINSFKEPIKYFRELFDTHNDDEKTDAISMNNNDENTQCGLQLLTDGDDYLVMDINIWKCLFDSKINHLIDHVHKLLNTESLKNKCDYLYLVGGFSASTYFQHKMKEAFGQTSDFKITVKIPKQPALSVVKGAAHFGITKDFIKARRLQYTYGVGMFYSKMTAEQREIPHEYILNNTTKDGKVKNCFSVIAKKNEIVPINTVKKIKCKSTTLRVQLPLLYSLQQDPKIESDGISLGEMVVPVFGIGVSVVIEFHFYGTTLKVDAYPEKNPHKKQTISIDYSQDM